MKLRGVFVDRDGTINVEKGHVHNPEDFEYIPRALDALKLATERNVKVYIITNQAGIAKGIYSEKDFKVLTEWMLAHMNGCGIDIAGVLYCPHHPHATIPEYRQACSCRKPGPGLLLQAMERDVLAPGAMALIGDKNSDIEAGRRLGMTTYLVETGHGFREKRATRADHVVPDLLAAMEHLLRTRGDRVIADAS